MGNQLIYLDSYILQQDMRIRLPRAIIQNMNAKKGKTLFDIYMNLNDKELILKISEKESSE